MVASWLLNSIPVEIRNSVVYSITAKAIWDDLTIRFRIFKLKKELTSLSQGSKYVTTYFTKFRTLVDEIDDFSSLPCYSCVAHTCTCEFATKLRCMIECTS